MVGINTSKIVDTKLTFDASKIAKIYNALYDIAYESQPSVEEVLKKYNDKDLYNKMPGFQIPVQCREGEEHNWSDRSGSDAEYKKLQPMLIGTYLEDVVNELDKHYEKENKFICRGRFLTLDHINTGAACIVPMHTDPKDNRLNMPVISNDNSFLVMDGKLNKLELGRMYHLMSSFPHSPVNLSKDEKRVHLGFTLWSK